MSSRPGALGSWLHAHRYGVLFYTMLLSIGSQPLLGVLELPSWPIDILLGLSLIQAASAAATGRSRWVLLGLIVAAVVVRLVGRLLHWNIVVLDAATATWTLGAFLAAASAVRFMLRPAKVGSEHLYAALSAYLLVGLFFGILHYAIAAQLPDAYSFVTLATLGYGDIVPVHDVTRGLSILEAVGGQLYLAVLVARLVGPVLPGLKSGE
jgi:hypothetical protein